MDAWSSVRNAQRQKSHSYHLFLVRVQSPNIFSWLVLICTHHTFPSLPLLKQDWNRMASGPGKPCYVQATDEDSATSAFVPSGQCLRGFSGSSVVRGERLELISENNLQLTSISDDSIFPAQDGDTASLAWSYTPLPFANQQISRSHVCEVSDAFRHRGITELPNNARLNEVQLTPFSQNSPPTFNDSRLFGNGSEYIGGRALHMSYPAGQTTSWPNNYPPVSQIRASSGQEAVSSISYVPSSASHSQQIAQTARMTSINQPIPLYEQTSSHWSVAYPPKSAQIYVPRVSSETNGSPLRSGVPSANLFTCRAANEMQTSRPSLPFSEGSSPQLLISSNLGREASSPSYGQHQYQRINDCMNRLPAHDNHSENAEASFICEQRGLPTRNNTSYMGNRHRFAEQQLIRATNRQGHEYKLNRKDVIKPELASYEARLQTFNGRHFCSFVAPEEAASAGLYLVAGNDGYTKCFACDGGLYKWQPGDDPFKEHAKFYDHCSYVHAVVMEQYLERTGEDRVRGGGRSLTNGNLTTDIQENQRLYTFYKQLVGMGFDSKRVKQTMKRIMGTCNPKEIGLDELLDDLKKTSEVDTAEDELETSSNCINDKCAVS